jgi:hypothetical protein
LLKSGDSAAGISLDELSKFNYYLRCIFMNIHTISKKNRCLICEINKNLLDMLIFLSTTTTTTKPFILK